MPTPSGGGVHTLINNNINDEDVSAISTWSSNKTSNEIKKSSPVNLLDNSNFTNPVNQLGIQTYTGVNNIHTIDRWKIVGGAAEIRVDLTEDGIKLVRTSGTSYAIIAQVLESLEIGTYTLAVKTDQGVFCTIYEVDGSAKDYPPMQIGNNWKTNIYTVSANPRIRLYTNQSEQITVKWIALYHGAYTIETLPEYKEKAYAQELLECKRYFRYKEWLTCAKTYGDYYATSRTINMRTVPTCTLEIFAPYGIPSITDFDDSCILMISSYNASQQHITYAKLPNCTEYDAGGLQVTLDARL